MGAALFGFAVGFAIVAGAELAAHLALGRAKPRARRPTLALGTLAALALAAFHGPDHDANLAPGPNLWWVLAATLPIALAGLLTDTSQPSLRRHTLGVALGAVGLVLAGAGIPYVGIPGLGAVPLGWPGALLATFLFAFLAVGVIELCSLVPLFSGLVALTIACAAMLPLGAHETAAGLTLAGIAAGVVLGRAAGQLLVADARALSKADVLALGFLSATLAMATFLKSVTLAGFVGPVLILAILLILIGLNAFESSLLLREKPR